MFDKVKWCLICLRSLWHNFSIHLNPRFPASAAAACSKASQEPCKGRLAGGCNGCLGGSHMPSKFGIWHSSETTKLARQGPKPQNIHFLSLSLFSFWQLTVAGNLCCHWDPTLKSNLARPRPGARGGSAFVYDRSEKLAPIPANNAEINKLAPGRTNNPLCKWFM